MSINARIKEVRLDAGLNIVEFAERIGVTKSTTSRFEQDGYSIAPRNVQLICSNFHVSEEWLLQGTGSKYVSDADNVLRELAKEFQLTPAHEVLVRKLLKLPPDAVDAIADYAMAVSDALVEQKEKEAALHQAEEQARQEAEDQAISAAVADSDRPDNLSDEEWELLKQMRIEKTLTSASSACGKQKEA